MPFPSRLLSITALLTAALLAPKIDAQTKEAYTATPAGPVVNLSATRAEIVLNGLWRWLPAAGPSETAPAANAEWGLIWVPGAWGNQKWGHYSNSGPDSGLPGVQKTGKGAEWSLWAESLRRGWYEREITVPADWAGRAILLNFDRIATDAELWLDDAPAGRVSWPGGDLDITAQAKPGRAQRLRILVSAVQTAKEAINYMGVGQNTATKATLDLRGLSGDVVLSARPATARVTDVFVKTSVRQNRLALDAEFAGVSPGDKLSLTAVVTSLADDTQSRTFTAAAVAAAPDAQAAPGSTAVVRDLGWRWADARRWDLDDPHLYRLELRITPDSAKSTAPADAFPVTFGFREFWNEGRDFFLNGTPIRLRPTLFGGYVGAMPTLATVPAELARWKNHGRNLVEVWPEPKDRGARVQDRIIAEGADRAGMLVVLPTVRINEYANGPGYRNIWETPEGRSAWIPKFHADWRRLRNHPSIIMIGLSGNFGGHSHDQNPLWIGRRAIPANQKSSPVQAETDTIVAAFDPTRLRFHHQGGMYGDVFTVNHYLNLIPLQEREEWFSEWARTGDMPYLGVEVGTPFNATMLRGRDGFGPSIISEPFLAEFAAIYFGAEAYSLQGDYYARAIRSRFQKPDAVTNGRWASWQGSGELNTSPAFQSLQDLFITRTWRAWRTEGISGGMIPWDDGYAFEKRGTGSVTTEWQPGLRGWFLPSVNQGSLSTSFRDPASYSLRPAGEAFERVNGPTLA